MIYPTVCSSNAISAFSLSIDSLHYLVQLKPSSNSRQVSAPLVCQYDSLKAYKTTQPTFVRVDNTTQYNCVTAVNCQQPRLNAQ